MKVNRILGRYTQGKKGALFICLAGIHGNELAGIYAFQRVCGYLEQHHPNFVGELIGIAGNLAAIEEKKRFIDMDLNRQWYDKKLAHIRQTPKRQLSDNEDIQQKELMILLERLVSQNEGTPIILLDMHTTSSKSGVPFAIANNTPYSKELASHLGIPAIVGVEHIIKGTTLNYFSQMNMAAFGFEAGQHEDERSIDLMETAIWTTLHKIKNIARHNLPPHFQSQEEKLSDLGKNIPNLVEFTYRHGIVPEDEFVMLPNFENFQYIEKGQLLANDRNGAIYAPQSGYMLMPLYQKQGEDGFFLVANVQKERSEKGQVTDNMELVIKK